MTEQNRLPRLDLHCHLDGSLSQGCIEELLGRSVKPEELQADMECQSLAEYLEKFEIPLECLQTEKGLERAGYDFMKNAALDHVSYIEARFAPLFSTQEGLSTERILEAVLKGMEQGKTEFGIDYGVIVCAMRHESEGANRQDVKSGKRVPRKRSLRSRSGGKRSGISDVVVYGTVRGSQNGWRCHLHSCRRMRQRTEYFGCSAVWCIQDRTWDRTSRTKRGDRICRDRHIGIEMCPLSNMQTKAVKGSGRVSHPGIFKCKSSGDSQYR